MDEYDDECARNLLKKEILASETKDWKWDWNGQGGCLSMRRQGKSSIPCGRYPLGDL